jgi:uncharacterized membrane protein
MQQKEDSSQLWDKIMKSAINLPLVYVDRIGFISKELKRYCSDDNINLAIKESPIKVLNKQQIDKIANGCIKFHTTVVCGSSALAGLPGGWFMAGTIPADIAQFYGHIFTLTQKLLYLYGWPDLSNGKGKLDDETAQILTLFTGVMFGSQSAIAAVKELSKVLAKETSKRLARMSLTKYTSYGVIKQIVKWFGVKLTKDGFAKGVGKIIPLVGSPISAGLTYATFVPMSKKLKKHLDEQYAMIMNK